MTVEFFDAVKSGDAARARELLASDRALARERDDEGATALHHAAERGHREIVAQHASESGDEEIARLFGQQRASERASPAEQHGG